MLYALLYPLHTLYSALNVFRYVTFRTLMAWLVALTVSLLLGPWLIARLTALQVGQVIRPEGPAGHLSKAGTPTMGGALILFSLTLSVLLLADLANPYIWLALGTTLGFGFIGFFDDYRKLRRRNSAGLSGGQKLFWQFVVATIAAGILFPPARLPQYGHHPLFQGPATGSRAVVYSLCGVSHGGRVERGQSDRRT